MQVVPKSLIFTIQNQPWPLPCRLGSPWAQKSSLRLHSTPPDVAPELTQEASTPRLRCPQLLCEGYVMPRLHIQGCIAKVTQPRLRCPWLCINNHPRSCRWAQILVPCIGSVARTRLLCLARCIIKHQTDPRIIFPIGSPTATATRPLRLRHVLGHGVGQSRQSNQPRRAWKRS